MNKIKNCFSTILELVNIIVVGIYLYNLNSFNTKLSEFKDSNWVIKSFEILESEGEKAYKYLIGAFLLCFLEIMIILIINYIFKQSVEKNIYGFWINLLTILVNLLLIVFILIEISNPILVAFVILLITGGAIGMSIS